MKVKRGIAQNRSGNTELVGAAVATLVIIIVLMIALMVGSELEDAVGEGSLTDQVVIAANDTVNTSTLPTWAALTYDDIVNKSETVANMTYTAVASADYWVNDSTGYIYLYNKSVSGDLKNHSEYNVSYTYTISTPWGNVTDKTGELGETGSSILKVGVILSILFAAVGFLIFPYIGGAPGGRGGRRR